MRRQVAPGPFERVLDQVEHPVQESEREAPDDVPVRLADHHAGEAHVRHALDDVLDLTLAIVQAGEGEPERLLNLPGIEGEVLVLGHVKSMGGHDEPRCHAAVAGQLVDVTEVFRTVEGDSDLLEGLPGRGRPGGAIALFHATAGERHVTGPGIVRVVSALDQQHFGGAGPLPEYDGDGSLLVRLGEDGLRRVPSQHSSYMIDVHASTVAPSSERAATVRAMDLPRAFVPEARRLLKLARDDRREAERALAALPPEQQATVVCEAPLSIRRQMIELLPNPEEVIPLIPEAEFTYTCRSIGLEDASWLLPMATDQQIVTSFDLDAWSGLTVDPARLDAWVAALASAEDETLLRAARAVDPEMLVLYLRRHVDVTMKPSEQDDPDWQAPDGSQTLEGQFYFVAKDPKDDIAPLLRLLHSLFQGDYWLYFRMIQAVKEEMQTENEEWALRWRTGRLEDLGFPSWDSSMRIYGFLRPEAMVDVPEDMGALDLESWALPVWITELPGIASDERALFRATRELAADERSAVFYGLIALSNRIAVADRMELGDPESLPGAIEKATRFSSDGLEHIAKESGLSLEETLRRVPLERLFRVGTNLDREAALPPSIATDEDDDESDTPDDDTTIH